MAFPIENLRQGEWLMRDRILVYPVMILAISCASMIYLLSVNSGLLPNGSPFGSDFVSFWTAARAALAGTPSLPYDPVQFELAQRALFPESGFFAFFYPPHYLTYMMPFGALSFYPALIAWMGISFAASGAVLIRLTGYGKETVLLALAFPATFLTITHGQNAFLSTALLAGGLMLLDKRPVLAGLFFGFLTFKPQFGIIVPFVLMAGGYWRTIISACVTTAVLFFGTVLFFGLEIWVLFLQQSTLAMVALRDGLVGWHKMISLYAGLRLAGIAHVPALFVHWVFAAGVAVVTVWAWLPRNKIPLPTKAAAVLVSALIITPFGLNYDLFLMAPAIALVAQSGLKYGFFPYEKTILALLYLSPIAVLAFMGVGYSPAAGVTILFFVTIARRAFSEVGNALTTNRYLAAG